MKTVYLASLEEEADEQLYAFLVGRGASPRSEFGEWRVPAEARAAVKAELRRRQIAFRPRYEFAAEPTDDAEGLAAYLGIETLTGQRAMPSQPCLAKDPDDGSLLVNTMMLDLLGPVTSELNWSRCHDTQNLWSLSEASTLPEPIHTPRAFVTIQGGNGLWMVLDDGRSLITRINLEHLRTCGIALSTRKKVSNRILSHPAIPVFGGRVLDVFSKVHVELAFPPLYLVPAQNTVSPW
jgi:hypothetical protein